MPGFYGFHGLRVLGLTMLDMLRFVERYGVEFQLAIPLRVTANQRVARHDDIAGRDLIKARVAIRPMERQHFQVWRKFFCFGHPVEYEAGWANDQRGRGDRL